MYIIVGLGNPGAEYTLTRHNAGREVANFISKSGKVNAKFIIPDTFMNKSGSAVVKVVKNKSAAEKLIVIHDDLDLPLGILKVSFNRGSGGHRGVESIIRALKTQMFIRIRIGISPVTATGKAKKPSGEKEVEKHILGLFRKSELEVLKKVHRRASEAVQMIIEDGLTYAMTEFNA